MHFVKLPLSTLQLFVTSLSCFYAQCAESETFCSIVRENGGNIKLWKVLAESDMPEIYVFSRPFVEIVESSSAKRPQCHFTYFDAAVIQGYK